MSRRKRPRSGARNRNQVGSRSRRRASALRRADEGRSRKEKGDERAFGGRVGVEVPQHRLILLFIVSIGGVGLDFNGAEGQFVEGVLDQVPVDDFVVSLVVVAEQVVIGSRRVVVGIVEAADLFCGFDHLEEYLQCLQRTARGCPGFPRRLRR